MKICIDVTTLGIAHLDKGGVYHYILNLLHYVHKMDSRNKYVLFCNYFKKTHLDNFFYYAGSLLKDDNFKVQWLRFPGRILWSLRVPIQVLIERVDVFHGPAHFMHPGWRGKGVVTVHDLDYAAIPESLPPSWVKFKRKYTALSCKKADIVIAVSKYVKDELVKTQGIDHEKIRVVHHGVSPLFRPIEDKTRIRELGEKYGILGRYILFVGQFNPNKNLMRLLQAFCELKRSTHLPHCLVLAGAKSSFYSLLRGEVERMRLGKDVVFTDYVPEEDLPYLYSGADLFILPSVYEGFGMPVLEAMASGVPVIASNVCSLPEIVEDAGLLVDPYYIEPMAEAIHKILVEQELRNRLIQKGLEKAKLFSWENTARRTMAVYEEVYRIQRG